MTGLRLLQRCRHRLHSPRLTMCPHPHPLASQPPCQRTGVRPRRALQQGPQLLHRRWQLIKQQRRRRQPTLRLPPRQAKRPPRPRRQQEKAQPRQQQQLTLAQR